MFRFADASHSVRWRSMVAFYLEQLEKERGQNVEKLIGMSRYVGELETQLLRLGGEPRGTRSLPHSSEAFGKTSN